MPYAVGDAVRAKISLSARIPKGSKGNITRVLAAGFYDVLFSEAPGGAAIHPPAAETVSEGNLRPAAAATPVAKSVTEATFAVGDRVRIKITLSPTIRRGSRGDVERVLAGGLYDVLFDQAPGGGAIQPPVAETVTGNHLEAV